MYSEKPKLHDRQKAHITGRLRTIALDVTGKCNMACAKCYAQPFKDAPEIDLDILGRALKEARDLGVYHYILQGGEPLCDMPRLRAIIERIGPDDTFLNLVTNGKAITDVSVLKDMGIDKISFSMDSGIQEEHDSLRGHGSFIGNLYYIREVMDSGLIASISTVATRQNMVKEGGFWKAYELAQLLGIRLDIQIAMPVGNWEGMSDILITPEQIDELDRLRYYSQPPGVKRDLFCDVGCKHCPAVNEFMAITVSGEFLPCNFMQITLGNIRDHSLCEMREAALKIEWFHAPWEPECLVGAVEDFQEDCMSKMKGKQKPVPAKEVWEKYEV